MSVLFSAWLALDLELDRVLARQKKPKILVTGATGFVGRHLVGYLLENYYRVSVYSRHEFSRSECYGLEPEDWFTGAMEDNHTLTSACRTADVVVHLANLAHAGLSNQISYYSFNIEGTKAVCEACREAKTQKLVYVSSALALNPAHSAYAQSKKLAEEVLVKAARDAAEIGDEFRTYILRPANIYGPGMKGNIARLIRGIIDRRMPPLPPLNNRFAMVSVYDVCRAIEILIENSSVSERCYLLTDGEQYTPNRVESAIYAALSRRQPRWRLPRVVFFGTALGAEILNRLRLGKTTVGLRTYQNLVADKPLQNEDLGETLGLSPTRNFEDDLPSIISAESHIESLGSV